MIIKYLLYYRINKMLPLNHFSKLKIWIQVNLLKNTFKMKINKKKIKN